MCKVTRRASDSLHPVVVLHKRPVHAADVHNLRRHSVRCLKFMIGAHSLPFQVQVCSLVQLILSHLQDLESSKTSVLRRKPHRSSVLEHVDLW